MNLSKSTAISPTKSTKSYKDSSFNIDTPQRVKAFTPFGGSSFKKNPSSSFFKAVSLTPAKIKEPNSRGRDLAILHESKIFKKLVNQAETKKDFMRRNPILQDNDEPIHVFKSSIRRLASADRMSENKDEIWRRTRGTGEFNYIYNPPCQDPKTQSIKTFVQAPPESSDEVFKPLRKQVRHRSEYRRNPITEGDQSNTVVRNSRKPRVEVESIQKLFNDRKFLLSAERGTSKRGQVFQQTFTIGDSSPVSGSQSARLVGSRPLTAMEQKMRGSIKGVLEYESGPKFRDDGITQKINKVNFTDNSQVQDDVCLFARKRTLEY